MQPGIENSGTTNQEDIKPIRALTKIVYGSGDWGRASFNTMRQIFYAFFLTDVVGLDPRLASVAALVSIIWDAVNDPLVGTLSDNVRTRWGRRRPFLLLFAIPFALAFIIMWWAPPWSTQVMLMIHVTLAFMVADTLQTLVTVPYLSLTPEIATEYDERTSLTSYRMFINMVASLATVISAPTIIESMVKLGYTQQQGYLTVAAILGGLAAIPFLAIFFLIKEKELPPENSPREALSLRQIITLLWKNTPFRFATGIYVLNWISVDIVALMIPYFLLYWISQGNMLFRASLFGASVSLETAALGILELVTTLMIPFWAWVARKLSKQHAFSIGMVFWIVVQILILTIQPYQVIYLLIIAALAGIGVSNSQIIPEAIFPDVIDWDELRSNRRREGMYYGAVNFIRKLSSALATFVALQVLGWFGYQAPPDGINVYMQLPSTLSAIRFMTGPAVAVLLIAALVFARFYPLSRERQHRIRRSILRRRDRFK